MQFDAGGSERSSFCAGGMFCERLLPPQLANVEVVIYREALLGAGRHHSAATVSALCFRGRCQETGGGGLSLSLSPSSVRSANPGQGGEGPAFLLAKKKIKKSRISY